MERLSRDAERPARKDVANHETSFPFIFSPKGLMPMIVTLFSTGCPKCSVLKKKLDAADISYTINASVQEMLSLGITQVPILSIDGELLSFSKAIEWVKNYQAGGIAT